MQFLDKLNYVEQELAATKGRESALQERLLKELGDYQERYRGQVKKINELEVIFVPWTFFFLVGGNQPLTHDLHLFICRIPLFLASNFSAGVPDCLMSTIFTIASYVTLKLLWVDTTIMMLHVR